MDYVSTHLPEVIKDKILSAFYTDKAMEFPNGSEDLKPQKIQEILIESFLKVDDNLMNEDAKPKFEGGTTATIAVVTSSHIVVANVGDSPSLTFSKSSPRKIINQTENHIPNNPNESKRVIANGGQISTGADASKRVDGFLSITRAFGHRKYKCNIPPDQQIISSLPQTYIWTRTSDMMLVLCSDSFTEAICTKPKIMIRNVLENEDILRMISKCVDEFNDDLKSIVNALCDRQIEKFNFPQQGYVGDNTSIILIDSNLSSTPSSPVSNHCNDDDSAVTDQSSSADGKASFATLYARCLAEGGLPLGDLSGIKRSSNCLRSDEPSKDSCDDDEDSRARSFTRSEVSSSGTTPISTPNRSRNGSFTTEFANFNVNSGSNIASSSWQEVPSISQSPVEGSVFLNVGVGLSLSPPRNTSFPSTLDSVMVNSSNAVSSSAIPSAMTCLVCNMKFSTSMSFSRHVSTCTGVSKHVQIDASGNL